MNFHTFGNNTNKVVIFIHGMLTPWQIWNEAIEYWSKDYYVILPELDAHTEETKSTFESVEKEAEKIKNYLCDTVCGKVYMMCGLSMGGRIAATVVHFSAASGRCSVFERPLFVKNGRPFLILLRQLIYRFCLS